LLLWKPELLQRHPCPELCADRLARRVYSRVRACSELRRNPRGPARGVRLDGGSEHGDGGPAGDARVEAGAPEARVRVRQAVLGTIGDRRPDSGELGKAGCECGNVAAWTLLFTSCWS